MISPLLIIPDSGPLNVVFVSRLYRKMNPSLTKFVGNEKNTPYDAELIEIYS